MQLKGLQLAPIFVGGQVAGEAHARNDRSIREQLKIGLRMGKPERILQ